MGPKMQIHTPESVTDHVECIHMDQQQDIHIFVRYSKKFFVRGVVRGIHFYISLLQRLSPEGGQNWHDLTLHKCSNTCKSNQNTSLTQPYGRKQRLLAKSPLVLNHIPCYTTFKTAFGDRLEVKRGKSPCNHPLEHFKFQPFEVYVDPMDLTR